MPKLTSSVVRTPGSPSVEVMTAPGGFKVLLLGMCRMTPSLSVLGMGSFESFLSGTRNSGLCLWLFSVGQSSEFIAGDHPLGRDPEFLIGHSVSPCHPGSLTLRIGAQQMTKCTNDLREIKEGPSYYRWS